MAYLYFRKTTAEDYDDVISIRKRLYDGLDYIPSRYHKLLETNTGIAGFIKTQMNSKEKYNLVVDFIDTDSNLIKIQILTITIVRRKTTADDYDDVVSIRKHLRDGIDYIPSRYPKLLETNTGFAGFIDNVMVSFMFAAVIDDGKSILLQSVRVRKEYEGQGIFTKMRKFCMMILSQKTETNFVFVTDSLQICEQLLQKSAKLIFQRNALKFTTTKASFQSLPASCQMSTSLKRVDATYLEKIISSKSDRVFLFPENRVVLYNVFYELMLTNVQNILSCSVMVAAHMNAETDRFDENQPLTMSSCTHDRCEYGSFVCFHFFGNINDEKTVQDHVNAQLPRCLESCNANILLYVTYSAHQDTAVLHHVLSKLNWRKNGKEVLLGIEMPV